MDLTRYCGEGGSGPRDNFKRAIELPGNRFIVQEHWANRFYYDFRLEIVDKNQQVSTLHSWIIPKNIPLEAEVQHLAIKIDSKNLDFLDLDKKNIEGQFKIWDKGRWGLMKGSIGSGWISFNLFGEIVKARYVMQKREFDEGLKVQDLRQGLLNLQEVKDYWLIWKVFGWG